MNAAEGRPLAPPPAWFSRALAAPVRSGSVRVGGVTISHRTWGGGRLAPIVLIHGSGANSAWWDHIAPHLAEDRRVVAMELSGHGDSDRRPTYDYPLWIEEVRAIAEQADPDGRAVVVGHSFGGAVALATQLEHPELFSSVITVDSPLRLLAPEVWKEKTSRASKPLRVYARREDAIRAFRTVPGQPVPEYLRRHVASRSVRRTDRGWSWKFDPQVFNRPQFDPAILRTSSVPVTLIRAEAGSMSEATSRAVQRRLGGRARQLCIPAARHHVMFDQAAHLITCLRRLTFSDGEC